MSNGESPANLSRDEVMSALFANLVIQQTQMAFMCLGRIPHPETGKVEHDLEGAKFFIDQLEMIETKTKGNLDDREAALLKQSLMNLRLAFVEAVGKSPTQVQQPPSAPEPPPASAEPPPTESAPTEESRKKFRKTY